MYMKLTKRSLSSLLHSGPTPLLSALMLRNAVRLWMLCCDMISTAWTDVSLWPSLSLSFSKVLNASRWPNYLNDGFSNSTQLFPDTSFINTALIAADQARTALGLTSKEMGLFINDCTLPSPPFLTLCLSLSVFPPRR
jgi:hypothetical protein